MKRISFILMAFALAMMMSQCKKNEGPTTSNDKVVTITLDLKQNNGSKVVVNPNTGTVNFETGDKIYVGSGGKYVGFLTHNGTNFSGNITNPTENQPLQFYFLGNVTPQETLSAGTTEECSVIISDQTEHLPVISCAASNENYVSGVTAYSAHLLNKCALVKFNVTTPSNSPICITEMKNKVTVDFTQNTMTPSIDGNGVIMLPAGSGENVEKWAILLPQEALEEGEEGTVYSENNAYLGFRSTIPVITENGYLPDGIDIFTDNYPQGAVHGLFSIGFNKQVCFSMGNLQYIGSASMPYWKFADNQWDYLGNSSQGCADENVNRDLFGWGATGISHGGVCWQPWSTSVNFRDYFVSGSRSASIVNRIDWGYNAIFNGGNTIGLWRTLSREEWNFLLDDRNTPSGIRYVCSIVNGEKGLILLPDDWNGQLYSLLNANSYSSPFSDNSISLEDWNNVFEPNGVVFLPCSGQRTETEVSYAGSDGCYWSTTPISDYNEGRYAYYVEFNDGFKFGGFASRFLGFSVRLVQDY